MKVSLHVPLTDETKASINKALQLKVMHDGLSLPGSLLLYVRLASINNMMPRTHTNTHTQRRRVHNAWGRNKHMASSARAKPDVTRRAMLGRIPMQSRKDKPKGAV